MSAPEHDALLARLEAAGGELTRWPNGEWYATLDIVDPSTRMGVRFLGAHGYDRDAIVRALLDVEVPAYTGVTRLIGGGA